MEHYQQEDETIFFSDEEEEQDLDSRSDCQRDFINFSSSFSDDVNPTREERINDNMDEKQYKMEQGINDSGIKMIRDKREEEISDESANMNQGVNGVGVDGPGGLEDDLSLPSALCFSGGGRCANCVRYTVTLKARCETLFMSFCCL